MARLGEICDIVNGYAFKSDEYVESGIRIIRISNVQKGYIEDATPVYYPGDNPFAKKYALQENDLLLSLTGNVGRVALLDKEYLPAALNQRVACLRPKQNINVDKQFLFHLLNSDAFEQRCIQSSKGVAQKNMSTEWLKEYPIPVPPIEKQREICATLDLANKMISLRKKQLQELDDLVKSRFVEMFGDMTINPRGWEKVSLGSVCDVRDGTHDSPKYYSEGYPLVTSKNVTSGIIDLSDCSLICEADYLAISKRSQVDFGDILMPMIGTVGKPVIVEIADKFAIKNVALIKFYPNSKVINIFVKALLESEYFDRTVISKVRGGTQKFIALGDIRKLELYLPPIKDQIAFQQYVVNVSQSKLTVQQGLDKLELLKQSLMQKYFG